MPAPLSRVLIGLVLVTSACTAPSTGEDIPSPTTAASSSGTMSNLAGSTSSGSVTATSAPPTADDIIEWVRVDDPTFEGGRLNAVVAAGVGYVAVGTDEVPEDAAVWISPDGSEWERVRSESFAGIEDATGLEGRQFMTDVAVGPAGIIGVGGYERRDARDLDPAVWISEDGLDWERVDDPDFQMTGDGHIEAITTWNGSYVAVGMNPGPVGSGERRPAVWTSDDGRDWTAADGLALRVDGDINAVVGRGPRLYAVGSTGHVLRPAVWFSEDGATWDLITSEDGGDSVLGAVDVGDVGDLQDLVMTSIAVTPDGFVAGGGIGFPSSAVFWESPDGLFWSLTGIHPDVERGTLPVMPSAMVSTPNGLVAIGSGQLDASRFPPLSYAEVWLSLDGGQAWGQQPRTSTSTAVTGPDSPWHIGGMHDLIADDGRLLAVGFLPYLSATLPGPFYRQAVWLGSWR